MSASESRYEPRREAEVVAWNDLTEDQRAAVEGAHGLFSQMAKIADDAKTHESSGLAQLEIFLPHIDEQRRNHVVLIDGERGTGKTAVMLRLLVDWSAAVRGKLREDIKSEKHGESPVTLESAVVPVGLLDLQALSPKAMLGLHLAGHLQRVVEAMERRTSKSTKVAPWAPGESEELKSRKAWRKFLSAAAAAWDGNLKERQGKIDPEAYIIELEHAERERLEIGGTFRSFVDALVKDYHQQFHSKREPFFVITIDDADMNPQRTMEIFELIRVLWHPRVGFLIAGDGDLFKTVLEEDFKQILELPTLSRGGTFGGQRIRTNFTHDEEAKKLATDAFVKAIPQAQRFRTGLNSADRYVKIADALTHISIRPSPSKYKLDMRDYFLHDEQLKNALPPRIRDVLELAAYITGKRPSPARFAWTLWCTALDRANLPRELRNKEFFQFKDTGGEELLEFNHELKWTLEPIESTQFEVRDNVDATVHLSARFAFANDKLEFPTSLIASYRLALEVDALDGPYIDTTPVKTALKSLPELIRVDVLSRGKIVGSASWYMPTWGSFRTYLLFFQTWRRVAKSTGFVALDILAKRYVELCLNLAKEEVTQNGDRVEIAMASEVPTWSALAARIVEIIRTDTHATYDRAAVESWASIQAFMLAAPEYGLSASSANEWLYALRDAFGDNWNLQVQMLRSYRSGNKEINAAEIDKRFSEHDWARVVESRPNIVDNGREFGNALDAILGLLSNVPTDQRSAPGTMQPTLERYVSTYRRQLLKSANPAQLKQLSQATGSVSWNKHGTAQMILNTLWNAVIPSTSSLAQFLQWDGGKSGIELSPGLKFDVDQQVPQENSSNLAIKETLSSGLTCCFRPMVAHWDQELRKQLTPASDFILRIAWDTLEETYEKKKHRNEMTPIATVWRGAALWTATQTRELYWPVPDWPALYEWENQVDAWNREIVEVKKLLVLDDLNVTQRVVDGTALAFIAMLNGARRDRPNLSVQYAEINEWFDLGKNLIFRNLVTENGESTTNARYEAYNDWWHRVVVMAAPELGLSQEAAGAFLDGLFEKKDNKNRAERDKAKAPELRRQHAIDCGIDTEQVDAILAQIDKQTPDHPWHKFFAPENT